MGSVDRLAPRRRHEEGTPMKKLLPAAAIAAVAASALVPSASAAPSPPPSTLKWGACPAAAYPTPDLQCTTLKVPLDYREPGGRKIDILVSKMPSKHPEKRRGVLLTNPGGPG